MGKEKTLAPQTKIIIKTLFDDNYYPLYGLALNLTQDENAADELTAQIFARVCTWPIKRLQRIYSWDKLSRFKYLARSLSNIHIDNIRKTQNRKKLEKNYTERLGTRYEHSPEATYVSSENVKIIKTAYHETLAKAPKVIRVAFYLHTERGLKNVEAARKVGKSPNTINVNFRRLRIKLKNRIC